MNLKNFVKNHRPESGFTLTEMMVALALTGVVLAGAFGFLNRVLKHAKIMNYNASIDTSFRSFGQQLIFQLQAADAAVHFQRLPIPLSDCDSRDGFIKDGPCLYELLDLPSSKDPNKMIKKLRPSTLTNKLAPAQAIEFYADRDSELKTSPAAFTISKSVASPFNVKGMTALNPRALLDFNTRPTYAAWVLKGPQSAAFPMMTRSKLLNKRKQDMGDVFFTVADESGDSSPPSSIGRWVLLRANQPAIPLDQLVGSAMVMYNSYDPQQFILQKVKAAKSCGGSDCDSIAYAIKLDPHIFRNGNPQNFVAFELEPLEQLPVMVPNLSFYGSWWSQESNRFSFPTELPSFFAPSNPDFVLPTDVRRLMHFYHTLRDSNQQPYRYRFIGLPIEIMLYSLEKQDNTGKMQMVRRTFPNKMSGAPIRVLNDIPSDSAAIFGRKIGTKEISFFIYNP